MFERLKKDNFSFFDGVSSIKDAKSVCLEKKLDFQTCDLRSLYEIFQYV